MINLSKYDIVYVNLNPTKGSEKKGVRPCLVIQNNMANRYSPTTLVAPFTTKLKDYPHNLLVQPSSKNGLLKESCLDVLQMRAIDKSRVLQKVGALEDDYKSSLREKLMISLDIQDILD